MIGKLVLFLGLMSKLGYSLTCTKFMCGNPGTGKCAMYVSSNNTIVFSSSCSTSVPYCNVAAMTSSTTTATCQVAPAVTGLLAGSACTLSSQCLSATCTLGACTGVAIGGACVSSMHCVANAYCSNSKCVKALASGSSCDTSDECDSGYACDLGMCKAIGSVANYQKTSASMCNSVALMSEMCASGTCYTWTNNSTTLCVPQIGYSTDPKSCASYADCATNSSSVIDMTVYGTCVCGYNHIGQGYCTPFPGDNWYQKAFAQLKLFLSSGLWGNCNQAGNPIQCALTYWSNSNSIKLAYYFYNAQDGMYIAGADSCTLAMIFPLYVTFSTEYTTLSSAHLLVASVLLSLII